MSLLPRFFNARGTHSGKPASARRPRASLTVERLEDRCLLSAGRISGPAWDKIAGNHAMPDEVPIAARDVDASQTDDNGSLPSLDSLADQQAWETYGRVPLSFEANAGQTDSQVDFLSRGQGYTLFLTSTGAVLTLKTSDQMSILRMEVLGADPDARAAGLDVLPGTVSYFRGNDPSQWRSGVDTYGRVAYDEVYKGIDLVYCGTSQRQLEYDFVVEPGADPNVIALRFTGAERIEVDAAGDLVLYTAAREVRQHKPVVYQETNGVRQEVFGRFVLEDDVVRFELGAYDVSRPLVIDPTLSYSTYLGGSLDDFGAGIAVDADGNVYVTGASPSGDFPVTTLDFVGTGSAADVIVTKFNASGTALIYSAYIGGDSHDGGSAIAVHPATREAYVTGQTFSNDFPLQQPLETTELSGDAFVLRLNSSGSALLFSTYLGGGNTDIANAIALGSGGRAFIAGRTASTDFPVSSGAFDPSLGGDFDAFVTVVNTSSPTLIYSTYLGGGGFEEAFGLARDNSENLPGRQRRRRGAGRCRGRQQQGVRGRWNRFG